MRNVLEMTLQGRKFFYSILKHTPKEQLLEIPKGYRNNIWWNVAHVVATQQILFYKLGGAEPKVPQELIDKFKKGTVPDGTATDEEIDIIKSFLFSTVEWAQEDYEKGLFTNYKAYETSAKITLKNIDDAIAFNMYHEGIHLGVILSLQKVLMQ